MRNAGQGVSGTGYEDAIDWIERAKGRLRCESSKRLLSIIEHSDPNEWWKKLKDSDKQIPEI